VGAAPGSGRAVSARAVLPVALVGVRVVVLALILIGAARGHVTDPAILRAERVATSPATPYRAFPVGTMPIETIADRVIGRGGEGAAMARIAIVAFLADLAAAWALSWGWGRRPAIVYLLLGLPLLSFVYLRFDLVSVALAAWGIACVRHRGEVVSGIALGLATMAKLWPLVLLPIVWMRRTWRPAMVAFGGVVLVVGAWWYLTGGPKGPLQVLTFQGARGWDVQSSVGSLLWVLGRGMPVPGFDVLRVGDPSVLVRGVLFLGFLACEVAIWRRAVRSGSDPSGGAALAAVTASVVFAPQFSTQYAAWLLPWAALAFEGDVTDQRAAMAAGVAIALTGVIAIAWSDPAAFPSAWLKLVVVARNLAAIGLVVTWFVDPRGGTRREEPAAAAAAA
jgi:Glycosyltransferase family 87